MSLLQRCSHSHMKVNKRNLGVSHKESTPRPPILLNESFFFKHWVAICCSANGQPIGVTVQEYINSEFVETLVNSCS